MLRGKFFWERRALTAKYWAGDLITTVEVSQFTVNWGRMTGFK